MLPDWERHGVRIVRAGELDPNTPQTPGMSRAAAITHASAGASKLWAGTVVVQPNAKTGAHHHGDVETVLYIVRGRARMRWGEGSSSSKKPVRVTSSTSRRSSPTRRSTPSAMNQWRP